METKVVEEGGKKYLVIKIEMQQAERSASGKTMVVASTHGNVKTEAKVDGNPITVGLNAYYKP
jgi:hypothetical protein